ncbi:MAG: acetyl-CoA C-acyltransferase [Myxococcales bacterium]|nr:acetyl-CoA C-acyltransferase [Myxococcales bacterium]
MDRVVVVAGRRTPFVKALTHFKHVKAVDLAAHAVDGVIEATGVDPAGVPELQLGLVVVDPRIPHMAREVVFRSERLTPATRAVTVTDNCITGTSAMLALHDAIALGRVDHGIAAGVESMSNTAILVAPRLAETLRDSSATRSTRAKLLTLARLRPTDLLPSLPGIEEPSTGLSMGEHTELMVKEWEIDRETQDRIAYNSHMRAHAATEDGRLTSEITPLQGVSADTIVRADTSLEKLARLKPVFDAEAGTLTAGNSSPLTDGAAAMLLMSEARAEADGLEPLAFIKDVQNAAIDPADGLLMAPGVAVPQLLARNGLTLDDIEVIELHEAFGGQVACNLAAWERGWKEPAIGRVPEERLNVTGGSIAIGHPFAATGIRIVTTVAGQMRRSKARYGLVSICAAGAQGAAVLLEGVGS